MTREVKCKYIVSNINKMSDDNKSTIVRMLLFRNIDVKQSNNGAYCLFDNIDDDTLDNVYNFIKLKLN